jgi:hypothetical protein
VSIIEKDRALTLLERARDEIGGRALRRSWLTKDPDLKPLKGNSRFDYLLNQADD